MIPIMTPFRDAPFASRDAEALRLAGYDPEIHEIGRVRDLLSLAHDHFRTTSPVISWGANYWALSKWTRLPPIIRNPLILVVAGGEVLKRSRHLHRAFRVCDAVVFLTPHLYTMAASLGLPMPQRWAISPLCTNPEVYRPREKKPRTATLIANAKLPHRLHHKGIDRLITLAQSNPDWAFHLIGSRPHIRADVPNLRCYGFIPEHNLIRLLGISKLILFLSRWEGMGVSLVEGMMTGCIPVVTDDIPFPPWAIGNTGQVLKSYTINLDDIRGDGEAARKRAIRLFSPEIRATMWRTLLPEVIRRGRRVG